MTDGYSEKIDRAIRDALEAHAGQERKDGGPYAVHPVHVGLMLVRFGADEDTIVAGILHDVVEDCDGWTIERVVRHFGREVAAIVDELTEDKSSSWQERKNAVVAYVPEMSAAAALVKAIDKLHNLRTLALSLQAADDAEFVWSRFRGGRERTIAHAEELIAALRARIDERLHRALIAALRDVVDAG